ncbi:MAG: hypothetical protein H6765_09335 [Candidatus Peribacteria bacterium]|nr:MAG: hypothetical protein H6765_09335 [Candidatus Peribacteria bacterium]
MTRNTAIQKNISKQLKGIHQVLQEIHQQQLDPSITNLRQYLALHDQDTDTIEEFLQQFGLKPVRNRTEHISASYNAVSSLLAADEALLPDDLAIKQAQAIRHKRKDLLLGKHSDEHAILLTLPSQAASDYRFIEEAVLAGISAVRINTAHDDLHAWKSMARLTRKAAQKHNKKVKIYVDLASRKMRTAKIKRTMQPVVLSAEKKPTKITLSASPDAYTCVAESSKAIDRLATVAVTQSFMDLCQVGDHIYLIDAKEKQRSLEVIEKSEDSCVCLLTGKASIDKRSTFTINTPEQTSSVLPQRIRPPPEPILVSIGDTLVIS